MSKKISDELADKIIDELGDPDMDWSGDAHTMRTGTILHEAIRLTARDRQQAYGHPRDHFGRTVAGLNARFTSGDDPLFRRPMQPQEWAIMVAIDKLIGRGNDTRDIKRDSLVDICGYLRTYEMVMESGQTRP